MNCLSMAYLYSLITLVRLVLVKERKVDETEDVTFFSSTIKTDHVNCVAIITG